MTTFKRKIRECISLLLAAGFAIAAFGLGGGMAVARGDNFCSVQVYSSVETETVSFTDRVAESNTTDAGVPLYYQPSGLGNACGAAAGAIVIGYYDRYYPELIPDYSSYLAVIDRYLANDRTYIPALMQELYSLMRTNVDAPGVSMSECLDGLGQYVSAKGRTLGCTSVMSAGGIDEDAYAASVDAGRPVLLFNSVTDIYTISHGPDSDTLVKSSISGNHVFVGYGYSQIKYYNTQGNFRTDTYLIAACGLSTLTTGYIRISSTAHPVADSPFIYGYSVSIS